MVDTKSLKLPHSSSSSAKGHTGKHEEHARNHEDLLALWVAFNVCLWSPFSNVDMILLAHGQHPCHQGLACLNDVEPVGQRRLGRPKHRWDSKLEMYWRYQRLGQWEDTAHDYEVWKQHLNGFVDFCSQWACNVCIKWKFSACALKGLAARRRGLIDWLMMLKLRVKPIHPWTIA